MTRRQVLWCLMMGAGLGCAPEWAQAQSTARPNVGVIDRARMVAQGEAALGQMLLDITRIPAGRGTGGAHDYYSDESFVGHRDALWAMCVAVSALAGAYGVTREERYAEAAARLLRGWFLTEATRMTPRMEFAQYRKTFADPMQPASGTPEGLIEGVFLAEVAVGLSFLAASPALTDADLAGLKGWFADYLKWLTEPGEEGPRIAALARDEKNRHGSSWLLQAAAFARWTGNEAVLAECRHRFERVTLRAQVSAAGSFPAELTTVNPYRNSLENLDLLAGCCELLSTPFESVWEYELQDGPGMRGAMAHHVPYLQRRSAWPYPADAAHFGDLPLRRPALVFGARAYTRAEYADLWRGTAGTVLAADPPEAPDHAIAQSFPIRQPYLWITKPPRRTSG